MFRGWCFAVGVSRLAFRGWRFAVGVSRFARLAVCAVGAFAVGGLRGWRFARLAVCAVGGLRGWQFARLAFCAVGDWRLAVGGLRWAFYGGGFVDRTFQLLLCSFSDWHFCVLGTPNNEICIHSLQICASRKTVTLVENKNNLSKQ